MAIKNKNTGRKSRITHRVDSPPIYKNDGSQPAFPALIRASVAGVLTHTNQHGMTLRQYYAAQAMTALLINTPIMEGICGRLTVIAFNMADQMIAFEKKREARKCKKSK